MTKILLNTDETGGVYYDCLNHAGDHDACTIISTLSNVLVEAALRAGYEPTEYEKGHVHIELPAGTAAEETFRTVKAVMEQASAQNPEHIRLY